MKARGGSPEGALAHGLTLSSQSHSDICKESGSKPVSNQCFIACPFLSHRPLTMAGARVTVSDPQKIGDGMSAYVSYKVAVTVSLQPSHPAYEAPQRTPAAVRGAPSRG